MERINSIRIAWPSSRTITAEATPAPEPPAVVPPPADAEVVALARSLLMARLWWLLNLRYRQALERVAFAKPTRYSVVTRGEDIRHLRKRCACLEKRTCRHEWQLQINNQVMRSFRPLYTSDLATAQRKRDEIISRWIEQKEGL